MRIMTCLAFAHLDRTVEIFFSGKFFFDVSQGRGAQLVRIVAAQAGGHLIEGKEAFVLRVVGRVAGTATCFRLHGFMRYLNPRQFFARLDVTLDTKIRHLFL